MNLKNVHFLKMPTNTNTSHQYTPHNQSAEGTPVNEFGSTTGGGGWRSKQNLTGNSTGYDDSNRSRLMTPPINASMLSKKINTQRGSRRVSKLPSQNNTHKRSVHNNMVVLKVSDY